MIKKIILTAILALALVFGMAVVGCGGGGDSTSGGGGTPVPGNTLAEKLAWLKENVASNTTYAVEVTADESFTASQRFSYEGKSNITINLKGTGTMRVISLSSGNCQLFGIEPGVTLELDNNITLRGHSNNTTALVWVGGTLIMKNGSKITGNTNKENWGGGVGVGTGVDDEQGYTGTFIMKGGEISGNTAHGGGGIGVWDTGTFIMEGGKISDNTATDGAGGGIQASGTFTMTGGEISGNTAHTGGGGVNIDHANTHKTFTMNGGVISGNTTVTAGGGIFVRDNSTAQLINGTIYGSNESATLKNTAPSGAALYVAGTGTVQCGTLSGTTWTSNGSLSTTNDTIRIVNGSVSDGNPITPGNGGTFTLTNIPQKYNGKYTGIEAGNGVVSLMGAQSFNFSTQTITFPRISNGSVNIPMWRIKNNNAVEKYSGNGTFDVGVIIFNSNNPNDDSKEAVYFSSVTFSNGSAARSWNDGQER